MFFVVVLAIPVGACVCLIGLGFVQKIYDSRIDSRRGDRRSTRQRNLRAFPGNPDIVLSPTNNVIEGNETTVTAVFEAEDNQDFDEMVPITTIQVNVDSDETEDGQPGESNPSNAATGAATGAATDAATSVAPVATTSGGPERAADTSYVLQLSI